ncbi:uncharacterized protein LOC133346166 isoform X1 [Lethenteron reissneri]|uniref:uncharacterized protein LOC133346166 isoform X1 n=3 Tax=Lethenteron reissneri TaxID=7753 RepID=UPI002AB7D8BD|nr:uncharacterized protein LOC133346166 isoform X1 [Lethenteron reissneri]XP_061413611.1 uncharacterized protein LOC133346166 isoform X1 [Lethenteron reissneri]
MNIDHRIFHVPNIQLKDQLEEGIQLDEQVCPATSAGREGRPATLADSLLEPLPLVAVDVHAWPTDRMREMIKEKLRQNSNKVALAACPIRPQNPAVSVTHPSAMPSCGKTVLCMEDTDAEHRGESAGKLAGKQRLNPEGGKPSHGPCSSTSTSNYLSCTPAEIKRQALRRFHIRRQKSSPDLTRLGRDNAAANVVDTEPRETLLASPSAEVFTCWHSEPVSPRQRYPRGRLYIPTFEEFKRMRRQQESALKMVTVVQPEGLNDEVSDYETDVGKPSGHSSDESTGGGRRIEGHIDSNQKGFGITAPLNYTELAQYRTQKGDGVLEVLSTESDCGRAWAKGKEAVTVWEDTRKDQLVSIDHDRRGFAANPRGSLLHGPTYGHGAISIPVTQQVTPLAGRTGRRPGHRPEQQGHGEPPAGLGMMEGQVIKVLRDGRRVGNTEGILGSTGNGKEGPSGAASVGEGRVEGADGERRSSVASCCLLGPSPGLTDYTTCLQRMKTDILGSAIHLLRKSCAGENEPECPELASGEDAGMAAAEIGAARAEGMLRGLEGSLESQEFPNADEDHSLSGQNKEGEEELVARAPCRLGAYGAEEWCPASTLQRSSTDDAEEALSPGMPGSSPCVEGGSRGVPTPPPRRLRSRPSDPTPVDRNGKKQEGRTRERRHTHSGHSPGTGGGEALWSPLRQRSSGNGGSSRVADGGDDGGEGAEGGGVERAASPRSNRQSRASNASVDSGVVGLHDDIERSEVAGVAAAASSSSSATATRSAEVERADSGLGSEVGQHLTGKYRARASPPVPAAVPRGRHAARAPDSSSNQAWAQALAELEHDNGEAEETDDPASGWSKVWVADAQLNGEQAAEERESGACVDCGRELAGDEETGAAAARAAATTGGGEEGEGIAAPRGGPVCERCRKWRRERKEAVMEFVKTELSYGEDLRVIRDEFYRPMQAAGLLTSEQLHTVFGNLAQLVEANGRFTTRLQQAIGRAHSQGDVDYVSVHVGEIFLESLAMLPAFRTYCLRQTEALQTLANLEREKELLRIFLDVSQKENPALRRMHLRSFLMAPLQRITKYPLLFTRLAGTTVTAHGHRGNSDRDNDENDDIDDVDSNGNGGGAGGVSAATPGGDQDSGGRGERERGDRAALVCAKRLVQSHLEHMDRLTRFAEGHGGAAGPVWRPFRRDSGRRQKSPRDLETLELREIAISSTRWDWGRTRFILEGRLQVAQPCDAQWARRGHRSLRFQRVHALLLVLVSRGDGSDGWADALAATCPSARSPDPNARSPAKTPWHKAATPSILRTSSLRESTVRADGAERAQAMPTSASDCALASLCGAANTAAASSQGPGAAGAREGAALRSPGGAAGPHAVRGASLVLVRERGGGKLSLLREPLSLARCVVSLDPDGGLGAAGGSARGVAGLPETKVGGDGAEVALIELQDMASRDMLLLLVSEGAERWFSALRLHSQALGAWRLRRNALPNVMIGTNHACA